MFISHTWLIMYQVIFGNGRPDATQFMWAFLVSVVSSSWDPKQRLDEIGVICGGLPFTSNTALAVSTPLRSELAIQVYVPTNL